MLLKCHIKCYINYPYDSSCIETTYCPVKRCLLGPELKGPLKLIGSYGPDSPYFAPCVKCCHIRMVVFASTLHLLQSCEESVPVSSRVTATNHCTSYKKKFLMLEESKLNSQPKYNRVRGNFLELNKENGSMGR